MPLRNKKKKLTDLSGPGGGVFFGGGEVSDVREEDVDVVFAGLLIFSPFPSQLI